MTPQYFHIITPFFFHFANYALCLLFVCIGGLWNAVGWVVLHGCVVHVYVHGEVMLWVVGTYLLLSMADVVCLVCRSCGGVLSLYGVLECQLRCELLLLLNMAHMGCLVCRIIIIGQCACKDFCGVRIVGKNCTRKYCDVIPSPNFDVSSISALSFVL